MAVCHCCTRFQQAFALHLQQCQVIGEVAIITQVGLLYECANVIAYLYCHT